ncbi:MAG: NAD-dependent epimerase/dehydratase family protein [Clostridia bacterium]
MTRVMITGAGSYLGTRIAAYLNGLGGAFETQTLDLRGAWSQDAFQGWDAVVHVAGIAHRRETEQNRALYFQVNCDLAVQAARAAKAQGVRQFVFFSSMSVYGLVCGRITADTVPAPVTSYGSSKYEAERLLRTLEDDAFHVAILRPPMIYGPGCKGNYPRLSKLMQMLPVFPRVHSERSMLYVGCLCAFVRRLLETGEGGLYFPQNREYVSMDALAREIARARGKRLWQPRGCQWLLRALSTRVNTVGKLFGSLTYDQAMSTAFADEPQLDFAETIRLTEQAQDALPQ